MKSVKIKVRVRDERLYDQWLEELGWVWNYNLKILRRSHCLEWYRWAAKQGLDLDGVVQCQLHFSRRSAWVGSYCQIAYGGLRWVNDEKAPKIPFQNLKGQDCFKHASKLIPIADHDTGIPIPWTPIKPIPCEPEKPIFTKGALDDIRQAEGLPPLTIQMKYIQGLGFQMLEAWAAYLDPKQKQRHILQFRDKRNPIKSLHHRQPQKKKGVPYTVAPINFEKAKWLLPGGLEIEPCDRAWEKRMGNLIPRSFSLIKEPSGYYLCIAMATELEALATLPKDKTEKKRLKEQAAHENAATFRYYRQTGNQCGIDPGVRDRLALDGDRFFKGNQSRIRIQIHIERAQKSLDDIRNSNDKRLGLCWRKGEREATNNEAKLQAKLSRLHERSRNSASMYNQKLSTRLVSTFDAIAWEDTQINNMKRKSAPKMNDQGHFEPNNGSAKSGLNKALALANIGQLRQITEQKMDTVGKKFVKSPAQNSSRKCHCCETQGLRDAKIFQCLNESCNFYLVIQDADINAAKNHRKVL